MVVTESEKKLATKEEELKNNAIDLVARTERLERAQAEIGLLKGELARLYMKNRSMEVQLEEAKVAAANTVYEYQSSAEMVALKQTFITRLTRRLRSLLHTSR